MKKILTTPIRDEDLESLNVGDVVYLTGHLVTCRDVAHRRLIEQKRELPVDLRGGAIFHAGPIVRKKDDGTFEVPGLGVHSYRLEATRLGYAPLKQVIRVTRAGQDAGVLQMVPEAVEIGCADCHTPLAMGPDGPVRDSARHLSGHPESLHMPAAPTLPPGPWGIAASQSITAWSGPWGVSFTANLTPDKETGLGKWSAE